MLGSGPPRPAQHVPVGVAGRHGCAVGPGATVLAPCDDLLCVATLVPTTLAPAVALWDMRFGAKPLAASGAHGAGEVWAVAFGGPVTSTDGRGGVGGLGFFATGDGQVGAITEDQGRLVSMFVRHAVPRALQSVPGSASV